MSPEAVQKLVESHRQFLGFLEKRVESRAVAEDILQDAFVRGVERGGELREDESVVAWFYRILRNAVVDHYRRRASAGKAMESYAQEFMRRESVDEVVGAEICQCVMGLIDTLKPEYQQALRTIDLGDGSMDDLAKAANISANNAAVRVHRARDAMRRRLQAACGTCAEHGCLDCHCKSC